MTVRVSNKNFSLQPARIKDSELLKIDWTNKESTHPGVYDNWMRDNWFNCTQYWTGSTADYRHPMSYYNGWKNYGFEVQTTRGYSYSQYVTWLDFHIPDPNWKYVQFETEVTPSEPTSTQVYDYIRANRPDVKIMRGHAQELEGDHPNGFAFTNPMNMDAYDGLTSFFNVNYDWRMGEDFALILAQMDYYPNHLQMLMPQPILGGTGAQPSDSYDYQIGIYLASHTNWAIGMWGTEDQIINLDVNPENQIKAKILEAWRLAKKRTRPPLADRVRIYETDWRHSRCVARCCYHAGYFCTWDADTQDIRYTDLTTEDATLGQNVIYFNDPGHPARPDGIKATLRAQEQALAPFVQGHIG
jgi:hypothetical protein